jgi:tetratricopeptide (TPR) repeat protein
MKNDVPELQAIWDEARGHIERGEYGKAVEIYKYILLRYSDNATAVEYANAYIGDIFLTTRQLDLAEKHLKRAIAVAPDKAHYNYLLGFTYSVQQRWSKAVAAFRKAIRLEHDNAEYERGLGWAMFNGGDRVEGMTHLFRALELSPTNVHATTDLGAAMLILGNTSKAREYGEKALRLDPGYELARSLVDMVERIEKDRS